MVSGYTLIECGAQRVEIRPSVEWHRFHLFGRHVIEGDQRHSGSCELGVPGLARNAQLHDTAGRHEDVSWLDVAMNDSLPVCVGESRKDLACTVHCVTNVERASTKLPVQGGAF